MKKTFAFRNRHGRVVHVGEEQAVLLYKNPAMKFLGEVITKTERKEIDVPVKGKGTEKREREVAVSVEYIPDSLPVSPTNDAERDGKVVKLRTVIDKGGSEKPRSTLNRKKIK